MLMSTVYFCEINTLQTNSTSVRSSKGKTPKKKQRKNHTKSIDFSQQQNNQLKQLKQVSIKRFARNKGDLFRSTTFEDLSDCSLDNSAILCEDKDGYTSYSSASFVSCTIENSADAKSKVLNSLNWDVSLSEEVQLVSNYGNAMLENNLQQFKPNHQLCSKQTQEMSLTAVSISEKQKANSIVIIPEKSIGSIMAKYTDNESNSIELEQLVKGSQVAKEANRDINTKKTTSSLSDTMDADNNRMTVINEKDRSSQTANPELMAKDKDETSVLKPAQSRLESPLEKMLREMQENMEALITKSINDLKDELTRDENKEKKWKKDLEDNLATTKSTAETAKHEVSGVQVELSIHPFNALTKENQYLWTVRNKDMNSGANSANRGRGGFRGQHSYKASTGVMGRGVPLGQESGSRPRRVNGTGSSNHQTLNTTSYAGAELGGTSNRSWSDVAGAVGT